MKYTHHQILTLHTIVKYDMFFLKFLALLTHSREFRFVQICFAMRPPIWLLSPDFGSGAGFPNSGFPVHCPNYKILSKYPDSLIEKKNSHDSLA